jgi:hypothetical protein
MSSKLVPDHRRVYYNTTKNTPKQWIDYNLMTYDPNETENGDAIPAIDELDLCELFNGTLLLAEDN